MKDREPSIADTEGGMAMVQGLRHLVSEIGLDIQSILTTKDHFVEVNALIGADEKARHVAQGLTKLLAKMRGDSVEPKGE